MVIAFRRETRAVFLYGFAKNERSNIEPAELEEFRRLALGFLRLGEQQLAALVAEKELIEVVDDEDA